MDKGAAFVAGATAALTGRRLALHTCTATPVRRDVARVSMRAMASASATTEKAGIWAQKTIDLPTHTRGCHLITPDVVENLPELKDFRIGMLHLFLLDPAAGLTLNEHSRSDPTGAAVAIPITEGRLHLGKLKDIWLIEKAEGSASRRLVATVTGTVTSPL